MRSFSPHTRGGSRHAPVMQHPIKLFPAHAGVIPSCAGDAASYQAFPRTRGGDPYESTHRDGIFDFSPHMRG